MGKNWEGRGTTKGKNYKKVGDGDKNGNDLENYRKMLGKLCKNNVIDLGRVQE